MPQGRLLIGGARRLRHTNRHTTERAMDTFLSIHQDAAVGTLTIAGEAESAAKNPYSSSLWEYVTLTGQDK